MNKNNLKKSPTNPLLRSAFQDVTEEENYASPYFLYREGENTGLGFSNIVAALVRNSRTIVILALVGAFLGYIFSEMRGLVYVTDAVVVLEPENTTLNLLEISEGLTTNRSTVETQLDVFKSTELLGDVIERVTEKHANITSETDKPQISVPNIPRDEQVKWLSNATSVGRKGESLALKIVVRAPDAILAADLANEIAKTYIDRRIDQKRSEILIAENILEQRTSEVRTQLVSMEKELAILVQAEQLNDTELDLRLRAQLSQVEAQIENLDAKSADELERLAVLREEEKAIQSKLIQRTIATIRKEEITREIENSRQRHEQIFEQLLRVEAENIIMSPGAQLVSAADAPLKPTGISSKTASVLGLLSLIFLSVLATVFTAAFDRRLRTGDQLESILNKPCLGAIPLISEADTARQGVVDATIIDQMKLGNRSIFSTSIRKAFFNLQTQFSRNKGAVVGITSCSQNEGKSTIAASLAAAASMKKQRVAIVDFDMWHQGVDALVEQKKSDKRTLSLEDWFTDSKKLVDIKVKATGFDNIDVFPWIIREGDNITNLDEAKVKELFDYFRTEYDITIVDTAPFMLVSETAVISAEVDGFVIVVAWEKITDQVLQNLRKSMDLARVNIIGSVMNRVDPAKQKLYGAGEYAQYYKDESAYH